MESEFFENLKKQLESLDSSSSYEKGESCQWRLLYEISSFLTARNIDLDAILNRIMDSAIELTGADRGLLMLYNPSGVLEVRLSRDVTGGDERPKEISHSVVKEVLETREIIYIPNLGADERFSRCDSVLDLKLGSVMCAPLKLKIRDLPDHTERRRVSAPTRILGIIYLDSLTRGKPFHERDLYLLQVLSNHATALLTSSQIYQRSSIDQLTHFLIRRQFELSLEDELALSEESGQPFSIVFIDIDNFRTIIENHGHRTGDKILERVAQLIRDNVRATDIIGRFGGDKFVILLPGAKIKDGIGVAGKLTGIIFKESFPGDIRLTACAGTSAYPEHGKDAGILLARADQALFKAKETGYGSVYAWTGDLSALAARADKLAGILTGDYTQDYRNVLFLLETVNAVNITRDIKKLFPFIVNLMMDITGASRGILFLVEEKGVLTAAERKIRDCATSLEDVDESIPWQVIDSGKPYLSKGSANYTVCLPLSIGRKILGAMYVDHLEMEDGPFPLTFFIALAKELSIAVENARLHAELEKKCIELEKSKAKVEELAKELSDKVKHQSDELAEVREVLSKNITQFKGTTSYGEIIGASGSMRRIYAIIERVAPTTLPVLIQGESGTGKELVARAIHFNSPRTSRPFLVENCAAIPETLLESELFGHVKGAFTGAVADRKGLFELANGGTLFLDEIGNMSLDLQAKLLRIQEERRVRPVGGQKWIPVDVRIITACNKDLKELIAAGTFREDLFYRINVVTITLPPLRERSEDIPALVEHFLIETGAEGRSFSKEAIDVLIHHHWPGNVRELKNIVEKLLILAEHTVIQSNDVISQLTHLKEKFISAPLLADADFRKAKRAFEKAFIEKALLRNHGNVTQAAKEAGIARRHFYDLMDKVGINKNNVLRE